MSVRNLITMCCFGMALFLSVSSMAKDEHKNNKMMCLKECKKTCVEEVSKKIAAKPELRSDKREMTIACMVKCHKKTCM